ncbi:MAG: SDR family NAD(P)-dependent oxidoreductase [Proteobacteria bacterium]|nr:SDR family NAD(P)-dependent oxidoreductase [Pseudomonadota bacterium]
MDSTHVALVTGATSGFGRAIAERFAAAGARVVAVGRRAERLNELAASFGDRVHPLCLDVRKPDAVFAAVAGLPPEFAAVTVLVNNAGLALGLEPAHETDWADWDNMIATNVRGLAAMTRAVLPGMVARKRGHVINIGSVAGAYPYPGGNVYGGTKAFVHQFSLNLRADLLGTRVRVTSIEPGMAQTEFANVRFGDDTKADAVYAGAEPLTAGDVADVVLYAASLPPHVNLNVVELMPTGQAFGPFTVHRER